MDDHLLDSDLDLIYTEIMAATRPEDVFGRPAINLPLQEQQAVLQKRFKQLLRAVDPQQYTRIIDANAASDAREQLQKWYETAKAILVTGTSLVRFTIGKTTYEVGDRIAVGTHSVIHRAIAITDQEAEEVAMKIARDEEHSRVLRTEAEHLRAFHRALGHNPVKRIARTLPQLLDTFSVAGRRVNVLPYYHGHRSVRDILTHFAGTLPVGHAAWIARRMLAFPLNAALAGLEHQAMTAEHLLVHPLTHEPLYLGWGDAVATNRTETNLTNLYLGDTFKEVQRLFQTGSGGYIPDTPPKLVAYLEKQVEHRERVNATKTFSEFTELIYETLGKKYRPLTLT